MLVELDCGDAPSAWAALGFAVEGSAARVGDVVVRLDGAGGGIRGWALAGSGPEAVDGIPTRWVGEGDGSAGGFALDHVVVFTDDLDRTIAALEAVGGNLRRRGGPHAVPMAFVRLGSTIVELVDMGEPTHIWGIAVVVEDLSTLPAALVGEPRAAVQPGRDIVSARSVDGLETQIAFMTPRLSP